MSRTPAQARDEAAPGADAVRRDDSAGAEILERFPLAMYAVAADGATGHLSPALQRVLGIPQESSNWQLAYLTELIHPDDRERVLEELAAGRETLEPFRTEYRLQRHDGDTSGSSTRRCSSATRAATRSEKGSWSTSRSECRPSRT